MRKKCIFEISVAIGLVLTVVLSMFSFGNDCSDIRKNVVRLHILANSNAPADQKVKLAVRDEILVCGEKLFTGNVTFDNAENILKTERNELIKAAEKVLEENGFDYGADIYYTKEHFSTRSYENFTLPAGEYAAIKVVLGNGEGKNWWCVMFPPLCLPAASEDYPIDAYIGENGADIVKNYNDYEVRFKIVEFYEGIKSIIKSKINNKSQH